MVEIQALEFGLVRPSPSGQSQPEMRPASRGGRRRRRRRRRWQFGFGMESGGQVGRQFRDERGGVFSRRVARRHHPAHRAKGEDGQEESDRRDDDDDGDDETAMDGGPFSRRRWRASSSLRRRRRRGRRGVAVDGRGLGQIEYHWLWQVGCGQVGWVCSTRRLEH